jgi:hypothetical protein
VGVAIDHLDLYQTKENQAKKIKNNQANRQAGRLITTPQSPPVFGSGILTRWQVFSSKEIKTKVRHVGNSGYKKRLVASWCFGWWKAGSGATRPPIPMKHSIM